MDKTLPHAEFRFSDLRNDIGLFRVTVYAVYINSVSIIKRAKKNLVNHLGLALSPVPDFTAEETPLQEHVCTIRRASAGVHRGSVPDAHGGLYRDWMGSTRTWLKRKQVAAKCFIQYANEDNAF